MKKVTKLLEVVLALVLILSMFACDGLAEGSRKTIALVVTSTESVFWQTMNSGARDAAQELGYDYYFTAPLAGATDVNGQVEVIENCISQGVAGILLGAADVNAISPTVNKAVGMGIPVVVVDCAINSDQVACSVVTNNYDSAAVLAEKVAQDLNGEGTIAILNQQAGIYTASLRENGFRDYMTEHYPDIKFLETQYYENDTQTALEITQNLITANPDLDVVYGLNEYGFVGAGRAIMERGLEEKIKVYGFDCSEDIMRLVENGVCQGVMVQECYETGYIGMEMMDKVLKGETVDKEVLLGCVLVTPENYQNEDIASKLWL